MSSDATFEQVENEQDQSNPSLQEIQGVTERPVISYKDQKLLLAMYRGELRRPAKVVNRMIHHGLVYLKPPIPGVLGREIELTLSGTIALDHILKMKEAKRARTKHPVSQTNRRSGRNRRKANR